MIIIFLCLYRFIYQRAPRLAACQQPLIALAPFALVPFVRHQFLPFGKVKMGLPFAR